MSTYSTNLALELIANGDQSGTWGDTTNTNLGTLIEQAISGYVTQACTGGTDTITIPNGATGVARNMFLELTGTGGGTLVVPSNKKLYFIYNNTSSAITVKVSGQTGVSVPAAAKMVLVSNGTDVVTATNYMSSLTLGSVLGVASGGTGLATLTANNVILGNGTSAPSFVAPGTAGNLLASNGTTWASTAPATAFTPGMLMPYAAASAPSGWLLCYGQAVSRSTYADLFAVISTTYGVGDNSTTFNLPDFRGRSAFGKDDMGGSAASRLTTAGSGVDGATLGTGGGSQLTQQHTHVATDAGHIHTYTTRRASKSGNDTPYVLTDPNNGENTNGDGTFNTNSGTANITNANYGSGASQNVPPALVVTYIIKT
jgi:microcystin-dependent protein